MEGNDEKRDGADGNAADGDSDGVDGNKMDTELPLD